MEKGSYDSCFFDDFIINVKLLDFVVTRGTILNRTTNVPPIWTRYVLWECVILAAPWHAEAPLNSPRWISVSSGK